MSEITKRALRDSLRKELETKPFDKITVRDITEGMRREPDDILLSFRGYL